MNQLDEEFKNNVRVNVVIPEIEEIIIEDFIKFEKEELKYSLGDLVALLSKNNIRVSTSKVSEVLKDYFGLSSKNGSYAKYHLTLLPNEKNYVVEDVSSKGRYYTFYRKDFIKE